ncbi:MAG: glycosyltransferase family 39 protein, partial [bacterium]|nr:glycosyltransferase family 39 protein [bacterium]
TGEINYIPTAHDMPGHGILLAILWYITGIRSFLPIQLLQMILDSFMTLFIFKISKQLFTQKIAVVASYLYALYIPEAWLSVLPIRDVWGTFGTILSTFYILRYMFNKKIRYVLISGIITGITVYFRPTIIFLPIILNIAILIRYGLKKYIISTTIAISCVFFILTPWILRNYYHFKRIIITRTPFYQTIWQGFGEFKNQFGAVNNDAYTIEQMKKEGFKGRPGTIEYDEFIKPKVIKVIKEHPLWYLKIVIIRIPYALIINRIPWGILQDDRYWYHQMFAEKMHEKSLLNYIKIIAKANPGFLITKFFDCIILLTALAGLYIIRKEIKNFSILTLVPIYFILIHIPIHVEGRYMVPFHWIYLIFISVFINKVKAKLN